MTTDRPFGVLASEISPDRGQLPPPSRAWVLTIMGRGHEYVQMAHGPERARYVVADAIRERAKERRAEGRPDKAGLLGYIASEWEHGGPGPSKKSITKAKADLAIVEARLAARFATEAAS